MSSLPRNKIINGDSLEVLKELDSESIDCVITSPPYWQLRDYGTGSWEGGDNSCNHVRLVNVNKAKCGNTKKMLGRNPYIDVCGRCGAKRIDRQQGLEPTFDEYISKLVTVFDEVKRVLKKEGTCWINLGDSYARGSRNKDGINQTVSNRNDLTVEPISKPEYIGDKTLCLIPSRFAIAMIDSGWILRNDIIWHKPNCMPESVKDRFTTDYEHLFFFVKNKNYYFKQLFENLDKTDLRNTGVNGTANDTLFNNNPSGHFGTRNEGRNKRTVWTIPTQPSSEEHYASYPNELVRIPVEAGCPEKGTVLDPFCGTATTCYVAKEMGRNYIGIDLKKEYCDMANKRLRQYNLAL